MTLTARAPESRREEDVSMADAVDMKRSGASVGATPALGPIERTRLRVQVAGLLRSADPHAGLRALLAEQVAV